MENFSQKFLYLIRLIQFYLKNFKTILKKHLYSTRFTKKKIGVPFQFQKLNHPPLKMKLKKIKILNHHCWCCKIIFSSEIFFSILDTSAENCCNIKLKSRCIYIYISDVLDMVIYCFYNRWSRS